MLLMIYSTGFDIFENLKFSLYLPFSLDESTYYFRFDYNADDKYSYKKNF